MQQYRITCYDTLPHRGVRMEDDFLAPPNWVDSLTKATQKGAQYVFARDISDAGHKKYTSDYTPAQMLSYQEKQIPSERNFYEHILPDKPVKLFFDIDRCPAIENQELVEAQIWDIIDISIRALTDKYRLDQELGHEDFAVLDSSGQVSTPTGSAKKTSLHIVLVKKVVFRSIAKMKMFIKRVFNDKSGYLDGKKDLRIDDGVYKAGFLRMPGSTKRGKNRFLRIITEGFTELDCMIMHVDDRENPQILEDPAKIDIRRTDEQTMRTMQARLTSRQLTDEDIFAKAVEALPAHLAVNYDTWIAVGIKLYTAGAPEQYWHQFSQKSVTDYNPTVSREKWESFRNYSRCSMSGLFQLLRTHNCGEVVDEMAARSLRFIGKYNNDIVMCLSRLYGDRHVYCKGVWYFFEGNRWREDENRTNISRTIMTNFSERVDREIRECAESLENCNGNDENFLREQQARSKNLYTVREKIQSGKIGNDWHPLEVAFEDRHFIDQLDTNVDVIGFNNGIYDLKEGKFRDFTNDDRVTMSTGYDFTYDPETKDCEELNRLLDQIFPDKNVLEYMMCFLGSCLSGRVNEELIHFWTGLSNKQTGANGKSTFVTLLLNTFGNYAACGHSGLITGKREHASSANSALISLKGKRLVTFQEIETETSINMANLKAMSGNDVITARHLRRDQETFTPQWKLVVCANKLPPVSQDDGGTRRRLRNVPFESKFVEDVQDSRWTGMTNVYRIDVHLKTRLMRYRVPMMHRLLEGYERYTQLGELPLCRRVMSHTQSYFKQQNALYQFLRELIVEEEGKFIRVKDIVIRASSAGFGNKRFSEDDVIETLNEYYSSAETIIDERGKLFLKDYTFGEGTY